MSDHAMKKREKLDILTSVPLEGSTEEKVDVLWRQLMVYKSFADSDLSEAKARRAEAEGAREQAQRDMVSATKALCQRMKKDVESELQEAHDVAAATLKSRKEAQAELERAKEIRARAEKEREQTIADAERRAQDIVEQAHKSVRQDTSELRRQALKEIRTMLTRVENMRAAVNEEFETQRILTNVSKIKAASPWVLTDDGDDGVEGWPRENGAPPAGASAGDGVPAGTTNDRTGPTRRAAREKKASSQS